MCLPAGSTFKHHALICLIRDSEQSTKVYFDVILCVCNLKNVTNVIKRRRKRLPFISYSVQRMPFGQSSLLSHRFLLEDTRKRVFRCTKKRGAYCLLLKNSSWLIFRAGLREGEALWMYTSQPTKAKHRPLSPLLPGRPGIHTASTAMATTTASHTFTHHQHQQMLKL